MSYVREVTNARTLAWLMFDAIVDAAGAGEVNPWGPGTTFAPDHETLARLLGVPAQLRASSQSGVPALALDVWVAHELRRAGFDPDAVWPRASEPRVLPTELPRFIERLPERLAREVAGYLRTVGGAAAATLLGKNYVKQVDVVISSWTTGPELLISTKRMDSSFGKNAANRVEESYGDAKNLRLRHPRAALGFVFALSARAYEREPATAERIVDLLIKLGREDDAYDAVALVVPDLTPDQEAPATGSDDAAPAGPVAEVSKLDSSEPGSLELQNPPVPGDLDAPVILPVRDAADLFAAQLPGVTDLPVVPLRVADVPPDLDPARFLRVMADRVLDNSPVDFHREARRRRRDGSARGAGGRSQGGVSVLPD